MGYIKDMEYNGVLNGRERIFHTNGDYFIGDFINGFEKYYESIFHCNQTEYKGDWIDDYPNGSGKEIYPDNSAFEGFLLMVKK